MIPDMKNLKLITILILLLAVTAGASAQSAKEYEQKKARLEREIAIIDRQLAENSSRSTSLMADLFLIRKNVANRKELVAESDRQIKRLNDQIYLTQREINRKQARIDTLSAHYSKLVVSAYKNRDARVWYMYMFASDNLGQAFRRFGYFRNLSSQLNQDAQRIREEKARLEEEKVKLDAMKAEAQAVRKERAAELDRLAKEERKADNVMKQLRKDRKKYPGRSVSPTTVISAFSSVMEGRAGASPHTQTGSSARMAASRHPNAE